MFILAELVRSNRGREELFQASIPESGFIPTAVYSVRENQWECKSILRLFPNLYHWFELRLFSCFFWLSHMWGFWTRSVGSTVQLNICDRERCHLKKRHIFAVIYWNNLPRDVVVTPLLGVFKIQLERMLSDLIQAPCPTKGWADQAFKVPSSLDCSGIQW